MLVKPFAPVVITTVPALGLLGPLAGQDDDTEVRTGVIQDPALLRALEAREPEVFGICDHDHNGWISFREAEYSLELDRDDFRTFDTDADGTVTREEFHERYQMEIERYGGFREPIPYESFTLPPKRTGDELRITYDLDSDGTLDLGELTRLLQDYGIDELPPRNVFIGTDTNNSRRLETIELESLAEVIQAIFTPEALMPESAVIPGVGIIQLFGELIERERGLGYVSGPPLVEGPVPYFVRLDVDRDGALSSDDLRELQRPMTLEVRPNTLLASLDRDGDGVLSEEEFRDALE